MARERERGERERVYYRWYSLGASTAKETKKKDKVGKEKRGGVVP